MTTPTPNATLLHQHDERPLGGWVRRVWWQKSEHLVEHDQRAQSLRARQRTNPGQHFLEQHAEHQATLVTNTNQVQATARNVLFRNAASPPVTP
jgi:hypothetical protein